MVNNYLLAEESLPFDMTYWFADPAHMPAKMLNFYIRNIVFENRLPKPGQLVIDGVPIDLGKIKTPTCFVSMRRSRGALACDLLGSASVRRADPVHPRRVRT